MITNTRLPLKRIKLSLSALSLMRLQKTHPFSLGPSIKSRRQAAHRFFIDKKQDKKCGDANQGNSENESKDIKRDKLEIITGQW